MFYQIKRKQTVFFKYVNLTKDKKDYINIPKQRRLKKNDN